MLRHSEAPTTRVRICDIRSVDEARLAVRHGAAAVKFVSAMPCGVCLFLVALIVILLAGCAGPPTDGEAELRMRILDPDGRVPDRARAVLHWADRFECADGTVITNLSLGVDADAEGRVRLSATPKEGPCSLSLYAPPGEPLWFSIGEFRAGVRDIGDLRLHPGSEIAGAVRTRSGAPAAGVSVVWFDGEDFSGPWPVDYWTSVLTDAEGRYRLTGVPADRSVAITAAGAGFLQVESEPLRVARGERATVDLVVEEGASYSGRVVDAHGAPAAGTKIHAGWIETIAAEDGSFTLRGLEPNTDRVRACRGLVTAEFEAEGLRDLPDVLTLPETGKLRVSFTVYVPAPEWEVEVRIEVQDWLGACGDCLAFRQWSLQWHEELEVELPAGGDVEIFVSPRGSETVVLGVTPIEGELVDLVFPLQPIVARRR